MENKIDTKLDVVELNSLLTVSATPHIRSNETTKRIMLDVIIALMPAMVASIYIFGITSALLIGVAVIASVFSEYAFNKVLKKPSTIGDLSAVVTGILLAFNVPVTLPLPMIAFAAVFSIIVVKMLFGGLGSNFMNPALAGRAALMASWPAAMSNYTAPFSDMVATATPLAGGEHITLMNAFLGNRPGCIGEVSAVCLLIGAAYLIFRKVITIKIPFIYILSTVACLLLLGTPFNSLPDQVFAGGLILGAFFMATDYVSAPVTKKGQVFFAIGCGLLTALIRRYGAMPEGVSYSILIMNMVSPLLDTFCKSKVFGYGGKK